MHKENGKILKTIISPIYNVKNTADIKAKLKDILLDKEVVFVSYGEVSLITNFQIHLAVIKIRNKWNTIQFTHQV